MLAIIRLLIVSLAVASWCDAVARSTRFIIFFEFNSSVITPQAARTPQHFADLLKLTDEKCPMEIVVTGHMDDVEAAGNTKALDVDCAHAAIRELKQRGRPSWTFVVVSKGHLDPLVPNPPPKT